MPVYCYACDNCPDMTDLVASIGTARRIIACDSCGGIQRLMIGAGVNIAPSALENKGVTVRAADAREGRWNKDMPAYKRMRDRGMQPPQIDGSAQLEDRAGDQFDVQYRRLIDQGISRTRIHEGTQQAKEIVEESGGKWNALPV